LVVVAGSGLGDFDMNQQMASRSSLAWIPLLALAVGGLVALSHLNLWLSRPSSDWQQRQLAPTQSPASVVVIDIDDASLVDLRPELGTWPFKRDVYALVIDQLREAGAQAIAIDLLLADPHKGDTALARAMAREGAPVVLAAAGLRYAYEGAAALPSAWLPVASAVAFMPHRTPAQSWPGMALPASSLWPSPDQPPNMGVITMPLDDDGRLRRLPLWHQWRDVRLPMLPLAVWLAVGGTPSTVEDGAWPVDDQGRIAVAFPGSAAAVEVLPFSKLARPALGLENPSALMQSVKGKVVFIGSSALLADTAMTVSGQSSGTAILAHTFAALRDNRLLRSEPHWMQALLIGVALTPSLLTWRRGRAALRRDALWAGLALVCIVSLTVWMLAVRHTPTMWAASAVTLTTGLALSVVARQRWFAQHQRELEFERLKALAANQAKSDFLANVSHEIRTPMNALLGVAELLNETSLTQEQRRHVQVFRESGHNLQTLINDLLDLSKIEAGRFEIDNEPFALTELLTRLSALMRPLAEKKGLRFVFEVASNVPQTVRGDPKRLQQALTNLLNNAIKFTSQGSVSLHVSLEGTASSETLLFKVSDTGIGIAEPQISKVFDAFTQADASVTRQYGGTGLGLSITREFVQLMGGTVDAESAAGRGSVFSVRLPLLRTEASAANTLSTKSTLTTVAAAPSPDEEHAPAHLGQAVLLAEDNEVNVYLFKAMLEGQGLQIDVATNGLTALDLAQSRRYAMIFMDVQMPGMDGLSVTRELRRFEAESGRARMPIIALTANAYDADVESSIAAGCDLHIAKPFTKPQLVEALFRFVPVA
jgi:signal transduction histidine kinase/ActR/RegA family two-component response regulator